MIEFKGMPECATSQEEYKEWQAFNRQSKATNHYCSDCTKEYQAEMISARRCQYPEVVFDSFGEGRVPLIPFAKVGDKLLSLAEIKNLTVRHKMETIVSELKKYGITHQFNNGELTVERHAAAQAFRAYRAAQKERSVMPVNEPNTLPVGVVSIIRHSLKG